MAFELKDYSFETVLSRLITKLEEDSTFSGIGKFIYFSVMNIILRIVAWAVSFLAEYDNEIFQELHLLTCTNYEHGRIKAKGLKYTPSRRISARGDILIANDDTLLTNPLSDFNIAKWSSFTVGGKKYLISSNSFTLSKTASENLVRKFDDDVLVPVEIISERVDFEIGRYADGVIVEELPSSWGKKDFTFELLRYKLETEYLLSGSITVTNQGTLIVGVSTSFLTDFAVGDILHVNASTFYFIESITDDTRLVITTPYQLASNSGLVYGKLDSVGTVIDEGALTSIKNFDYKYIDNSETVGISNGSNLLTCTGNIFTEDTNKIIIYTAGLVYSIVEVATYNSPTEVVLTENWTEATISGKDFGILINDNQYYGLIDFEEIKYTKAYTGISIGDTLPVDQQYEEVNYEGSGLHLVVTNGSGVPIDNGELDNNTSTTTIIGSTVLDSPTEVTGETFIIRRDGVDLPTFTFSEGNKLPSAIVSDFNSFYGGDLIFSLDSGKLKIEYISAGTGRTLQVIETPSYLFLSTALHSDTGITALGGLPQVAPYVLSESYEVSATPDLLESVVNINSIPLDINNNKIDTPFNSHNKYVAIPVVTEIITERIIVNEFGEVLDTNDEIVETPYDHRNTNQAILLMKDLFYEPVYCVHDADDTKPVDLNNNHLIDLDYVDYYKAKRVIVTTESIIVPTDGYGIPQSIDRDQDGNYLYDGTNSILLSPLDSPYDEQELHTTGIITYLYYKTANVIQGELKEVFYNSTGKTNEHIIIDNDSVEHNNLVIEVAFSKDINGNAIWTEYSLVDSFYNSRDEDTHYLLEPFDFMQKIKITFPNGIKGKKLPEPSELIPSDNIRVSFIETDYTNSEITSVGLECNFDEVNLQNLYAINTSVLLGASDNETLEGIKENAPKVFQKGDNAIDYEGWKIAILRFGSIQEVAVIGELDTLVTGEVANIEMANYVKIYLVPKSGITLDTSFYDNLTEFLLNEKSITDIPIYEQIKYINVIFTISNIVKSSTAIDDFEILQKNYLKEEYKLSSQIIGEGIIKSKVIQDLKNESSLLVDVDVSMKISQVIDLDTAIEYKTYIADVDKIDIVLDYTLSGVAQPNLTLNSTDDFPSGSLLVSSPLFSSFNFNFSTGELVYTLNTNYIIMGIEFLYTQKDVGSNTDNVTIDNTMITQYSDYVVSTVFEG